MIRFVAVCASVLALTLAGCGAGGSTTPPTVTGPQPDRIQRPCDLYATATPCEAAYSTTRSLFGGYTGALYQVSRQSDETTADIGLLPDGYANAAAQDTFCSNAVCIISIIYDQTANRNNLTVAPPSSHASGPGPNGYDLPAIASALPVMAGGHKVYGVSIVPGTGYRNDATTGIPIGAQAQGVYMVSSTSKINGRCCFDFGNAETSNSDKGPGHMDAINLFCPSTVGSTCPRATLDLEDGLFGFLRVSTASNFVTVMGANDGQQTFTIWQGDATGGALTSTGPETLASGYAPMNQEGAIILGIGGDNSNAAAGYFFEGVMTKGTPSESSMNAVQGNIVSAIYGGLLGS